MIHQFVLGSLLTLVIVVFHAIALALVTRFLIYIASSVERLFANQWYVAQTVVAVTAVFAIHFAEIWIWALAYLGLGVLASLEESVYFSTVTFTTLGYGDIVLPSAWRLLGAIQGAVGFVLFGWSTAFIFEVMSRSWRMKSGEAP